MARPKLIVAESGILLGSLAALGSSLAYGGNSVLAKWLVDDYTTPLVLSTFTLLFGTAVMLAAMPKELPRSLRLTSKCLTAIFLTGAASAGGAMAFYFALGRADVVIVAPIASINPLVTLILAHLYLQRLERVTARVVAGAVLVVLGVVLVIGGRDA